MSGSRKAVTAYPILIIMSGKKEGGIIYGALKHITRKSERLWRHPDIS
jgi:hypothetical protein